ncbi:MAG: HAD family hydrolase [Candidatus Hydrogenedentes bacterium]|nr:HAD family hydrolase [Candidatus Hydrogenedentota bacterium]
MITAVCFDLDGTLIDSTEAIVESFYHTFDTFNEPRPPRDAIVNSIGYVLEEQFALLSTHDPVECTKVYRAYYETICCPKTTLMPGTRECLQALHDAGLEIAFATSKRRKYSEMILEHLGVLDFFSVRLGPDDVSKPKPDPEVVLKACEMLHVTPQQLLFVGDMHFDVLAAREAGVRCLCVTTGYATREELEALEPERVFDGLDQLTAYVVDNVLGAMPAK